jgi:tRNA threonylcarbamoyladenosine biosynthesis protein TsaE
MKNLTFLLRSEKDTERLAKKIAALLAPGDIVFLKGPLGSGKTTFARYLIQSFSPKGPKEDVLSPTFTLVQIYSNCAPSIWHFDLYRLESIEEVWELGLEEAFASGITLIEWPERLEPLHLKPKISIHFEVAHNQTDRTIKIVGETLPLLSEVYTP